MLRFFYFSLFCLLAFPSLFARGKGEPCFLPEANGAAVDTVGGRTTVEFARKYSASK